MKYFDYAATTPIKGDVLNVYCEVSNQYFGNTSSSHDIGLNAKELLEGCRKELANLIGCASRGIYFTSGGSESNFLAIHSLALALKDKGNHIISTMAEHSSIHYSLSKLEELGWNITYLPLKMDGTISLDQIKKAIQPETVLISIHHCNSELGTIQPIKEIGMIAKKAGIALHTDCVQSFGKLDLKEVIPFVDSLSLSSHKIYGPKGVGAVYINPLVNWQPYYPNTSHEFGFRPGTVNVAGIAGFITAAQLRYIQIENLNDHWNQLRKIFFQELLALDTPIEVFQAQNQLQQLPSIIGLCIQHLEGQYVMLELNRKGYAVSTGSACSVGQQSPSKTMLAIGKNEQEAKRFIRISFGEETTIDDVKALAANIHHIAMA